MTQVTVQGWGLTVNEKRDVACDGRLVDIGEEDAGEVRMRQTICRNAEREVRPLCHQKKALEYVGIR